MAILFFDGFAGGDIPSKWDANSQVFAYGSASPRVTGGYWAQLGFGQNSVYKSFSAQSKIIAGYALNNGQGYFSVYGDAGVTQHITVIRNSSSGVLEIRRGSNTGTLLASSTEVTPAASWYQVEVSVTISDTVGEVHVRLNGSTTDVVSYSGDTKNGGTNSTIDKVSLTALVNNFCITDVYIINDSGSTNNSFLGDVTVRSLSPNNNGNSSQLLGSDGNSTDNYLLVDEKPFSSTDYTGSATTGQKDTYTLADLPAVASTIYGVQINANMVKSDAGASQSRTVLRTGGTDYTGTTRVLSTSSATYTELYELNPNTTSAWTSLEVNGLEAGMEVM